MRERFPEHTDSGAATGGLYLFGSPATTLDLCLHYVCKLNEHLAVFHATDETPDQFKSFGMHRTRKQERKRLSTLVGRLMHLVGGADATHIRTMIHRVPNLTQPNLDPDLD